MGRMKTQSQRFTKKMAQDALRKEHFRKQKEQSTAIVDLSKARILLREILDSPTIFPEALTQKIKDFLDGKGSGTLEVQEPVEVTDRSGDDSRAPA